MSENAADLIEAISSPTGISVLALLTIWDIVWRLLAMWKAAKRGEKVWFVLLAILSTLGILPIVYYFLLAKKNEKH